MTVYIDLDSTMFDFITHFSLAHYKNTGERIFPTPEELRNEGYYFHRIFGLPDSIRYKYLTEEFFATIGLYPGAKEAIEQLYDMNLGIKFVTNAVTDEAYSGKIKSLRNLFPHFHRGDLIVIRDKHYLVPGVIIDDNPYVLLNSFGHHYVIKASQPYNGGSPCDVEFNPQTSWGDVPSLVEKAIG